ncbi:MAG TPA: hypothetical protein VFK44_10000 [Bacillales bacterium]|nr:hypothetical protein [Bacillales bacterium]
MASQKERKSYTDDKEIPTDTPLNPELQWNVDENSADSPFPFPGDSVDEHKELEHANRHFAEEIAKQQNENL